MSNLILVVMAGLLGIGTGVFIVLSFIEKPVWGLMRNPAAPHIADLEARKVHAILRRLINLLPPTMLTIMANVTALMALLLVQANYAVEALALCGLFLIQLALIIARLRRDIRGVKLVSSDDAQSDVVRTGLSALALLHHRGLVMTGTTLLGLIIYQAWFNQ